MLLDELSKKSNHKRKLILDGLGSALGSMGPGLAVGGGLAAAGAAVGDQRQQEHAHKMRMVEDEMAATTFMIEFDDQDVGNLFRTVNRMGCLNERFKNMMKVMQTDIQRKINDYIAGTVPL